MENDLQRIVARQGLNTMEFAQLVKENESILESMKVKL